MKRTTTSKPGAAIKVERIDLSPPDDVIDYCQRSTAQLEDMVRSLGLPASLMPERRGSAAAAKIISENP